MDQSTPPEHFLCPLTLEVMNDPVQHRITKYNYERGAILHWIYYGNATCPLSRQPLEASDLEDNQDLESEIYAWRGEEEKPNVSYPALPEAPRESREEDGEEVTTPKKQATKKERAILRKLQKLRQTRNKPQREVTSATC